MYKPIIVIIDSGVDESHPQFCKDNITQISFGCQHKEVGKTEKLFGHGTAIYGIIRSCSNIADIINIRVANIEEGIDDETLISVLQYVYTNIEANIINLSLGIRVSQNKRELRDICDKLCDKGVIIVSAFDNMGTFSYPAAFDNVIGVVSSDSCNKITDFLLIDDKNSVINIGAKGGIQRVLWSNPRYLLLSGNSIACAHVTVQIAKLFQEGILDKEEILNKIGHIAICKKLLSDPPAKEKMFSINRAVLFPFNKEMHGLIRYYSLLEFEIVDVYDVKYSSNIGSTTKKLLGDDTVQDFCIKNIDNIDYDSFDTIILGHLDELSTLVNKKKLRSELLQEAIRRKKNIYAFDDLKKSDGIEKSENVFYPTVSYNDLPANRFGMLYQISKPVVGVFGTSSRQGKFTLQLALRKTLCERGYNIGQIGTEPSALLYGMDYVYPMGYNSSVYLTEYNSVRFLNHLINNLCEKEKDIIIVGSQSGSVLYDTSNLRNYNIPQYMFLLGTLPDLVILCINPYDDIQYIKRTISFIESSVNSKVVALVLFPMDISDDWTGIYGSKKRIENSRIPTLKEYYFQTLKKPVFCLGNSTDYESIVDIIEDFFT